MLLLCHRELPLSQVNKPRLRTIISIQLRFYGKVREYLPGASVFSLVWAHALLRHRDALFWHKADIAAVLIHVRFWG